MSIRHLHRYVLEGLAVIGPIGVSIWVLVWLFDHLDRILGQYLDPALGWSIPGVGLVALLVLGIGGFELISGAWRSDD